MGKPGRGSAQPIRAASCHVAEAQLALFSPRPRSQGNRAPKQRHSAYTLDPQEHASQKRVRDLGWRGTGPEMGLTGIEQPEISLCKR